MIVTSVVTIAGSADAVTSTATSTGRSLNGTGAANTKSSFFSNTGAVAGVFVVVGLVAAGIVLGIAYFFFRRKRARRLDHDIRIAAGGAGDGGAGVDRFGEDDDPFNPATHSDHGHNYATNNMSSFGSAMPVMAGAAGAFGSSTFDNGYETNPNAHKRMSYGDPAYSPSSSGGAPTYATYPAFAAQSHQYAGPRSQEGALYPDYAEYVDGMNAGSHEGSASPNAQGSRSEEAAGASNNGHSGTSGSRYDLRNSGEWYSGDVNRYSNPVSSPDERMEPMATHDADTGSLAGDENDYSRRILRVANPGADSAV